MCMILVIYAKKIFFRFRIACFTSAYYDATCSFYTANGGNYYAYFKWETIFLASVKWIKLDRTACSSQIYVHRTGLEIIMWAYVPNSVCCDYGTGA